MIYFVYICNNKCLFDDQVNKEDIKVNKFIVFYCPDFRLLDVDDNVDEKYAGYKGGIYFFDYK